MRTGASVATPPTVSAKLAETPDADADDAPYSPFVPTGSRAAAAAAATLAKQASDAAAAAADRFYAASPFYASSGSPASGLPETPSTTAPTTTGETASGGAYVPFCASDEDAEATYSQGMAAHRAGLLRRLHRLHPEQLERQDE